MEEEDAVETRKCNGQEDRVCNSSKEERSFDKQVV
jgi:hypothetical protein